MLKGLKRLAIQMISAKHPLSIKDFIHSFNQHIYIYVSIQDLEQGTGSGIRKMGGNQIFSRAYKLQIITQL